MCGIGLLLCVLEKLSLDDDLGAVFPVREQVWGWDAGGAENSGVILVLGLCPVRSCQAGKGKATGFNPGRKRFGSLHQQGGGKSGVWSVELMVGAAVQEWDHPLQCHREKRGKKGETGGKCRFPLGLGPSTGCACSLLPPCLLGFALRFPAPSLLKNKPGAP